MRFNGWTESSMFQYMLLLRGATAEVKGDFVKYLFQYMLLLRGATSMRTA